MDNANKILGIFLSDKNEISKWMSMPFTVNGKTGATNAYSVVLLPFASDYEDMSKKFEGIIPTPNCSIRYSVAKLKECYNKIPLVDLPPKKECPECNGHCEVTYEYCGNESTHYKDIDCPICDGIGLIIDLESKKFEQEPDQTQCIAISKGKFNCFRVSEIIQTAEFLGADHFTLIHEITSEGKFLFTINDVEIIIQGALFEDGTTISTLESEVNNV